MPLNNLPAEELLAIAQKIHANKIFTHLQIKSTDINMLPTVFMPIALMDKAQHEEFLKLKPALIYEEMLKATSRSVNGYPVFMSMRLLNEHDAQIVMSMFTEMAAAMSHVSEKHLTPTKEKS